MKCIPVFFLVLGMVCCMMVMSPVTGEELLRDPPSPGLVLYPVVDTGQYECFNNIRTIPCPQQGQAFFGQDAQYSGNSP
jgi:hypothetical protein